MSRATLATGLTFLTAFPVGVYAMHAREGKESEGRSDMSKKAMTAKRVQLRPGDPGTAVAVLHSKGNRLERLGILAGQGWVDLHADEAAALYRLLGEEDTLASARLKAKRASIEEAEHDQ